MSAPSTSKRKRVARAPTSGIYKSDSVLDVAESLGITNLPENVASALASDVEYRLNQVIETASRFTRHAKRSTMTTSDVDLALKTLNIPPLYGHSMRRPGSPPPTFRRLHPSVGPPIFVVEDEEVDFEKVVKEEEIQVPRNVRYTAHWLAIEGVQPLIPENPPPLDPPTSVPTKPISQAMLPTPPPTQSTQPSSQSQLTNGASKSTATTSQPIVKTALPRQLQLYYTHLTSALLPPAESPSDHNYERKKLAALSSLRSDAGLQQVLPYIVKWAGEHVVRALRSGVNGDGNGVGGIAGMGDEDDNVDLEIDRRSLEVLLDVITALLDNPRLFIEPYLHQLLPPILSILLISSLTVSPHPLSLSTAPTPSHLRKHASSLLSHLLHTHFPSSPTTTAYGTLAPRLTKTLLAALVEPGRAIGTREGAVRGLMGIGREAVRRGLIDAGGANILSEELSTADREIERYGGSGDGGPVALENAIMSAFELIHPSPHPRTQLPTPLNPQYTEKDQTTVSKLQALIGEYFTNKLVADGVDASWAAGLAESLSSSNANSQASQKNNGNGLSDMSGSGLGSMDVSTGLLGGGDGSGIMDEMML